MSAVRGPGSPELRSRRGLAAFSSGPRSPSQLTRLLAESSSSWAIGRVPCRVAPPSSKAAAEHLSLLESLLPFHLSDPLLWPLDPDLKSPVLRSGPCPHLEANSSGPWLHRERPLLAAPRRGFDGVAGRRGVQPRVGILGSRFKDMNLSWPMGARPPCLHRKEAWTSSCGRQACTRHAQDRRGFTSPEVSPVPNTTPITARVVRPGPRCSARCSPHGCAVAALVSAPASGQNQPWVRTRHHLPWVFPASSLARTTPASDQLGGPDLRGK